MIKRKTKRRSSELAELDRASREIENRIQELEASLKRPAQQTRMRLDRNTMPPPDRVREGTQNRALRAESAELRRREHERLARRAAHRAHEAQLNRPEPDDDEYDEEDEE